LFINRSYWKSIKALVWQPHENREKELVPFPSHEYRVQFNLILARLYLLHLKTYEEFGFSSWCKVPFMLMSKPQMSMDSCKWSVLQEKMLNSKKTLNLPDFSTSQRIDIDCALLFFIFEGAWRVMMNRPIQSCAV
jgi:hypothetical protein